MFLIFCFLGAYRLISRKYDGCGFGGREARVLLARILSRSLQHAVIKIPEIEVDKAQMNCTRHQTPNSL